MKQKALHSKIATLGSASIFGYAVQLVLPIILVRVLEDQEFVKYRMLFLLVNTASALAPLYMPQALFYFLSRAENKRQQVLYISNTIIFLFIAGGVVAVILNPWFPIIPVSFFSIASSQGMVPAFILMWVVASLIDLLPNACNLIQWQAILTVLMNIVRVVLVVGTAWITNDVSKVFVSLCLFVSLKTFALLLFIKIYYPKIALEFDLLLFKEQIKYALPFGLSSMFYMLKVQSDQWVAAFLFSPMLYTTFSFGIYVAPLVNLLRNSINNALLPDMGMYFAKGKIDRVLNDFQYANLMMGLVIFPVLSILFSAADRIIIFLFTDVYHDAACVMRVYAVGFIAQCLEATVLLRLVNAGKVVMKLNALLLPFSVLISYVAGELWSLPGAALGSVLTLYVGEGFNLWYSARAMRINFSRIVRWRCWGVLFLSSLVSSFAGSIIAKNIFISPFFDIMIIAIVCISFYIVSLFIGRVLNLISLNDFRCKS